MAAVHRGTQGDVAATQGETTPILGGVDTGKQAMGRVHGTMEQRKRPMSAVWGHTELLPMCAVHSACTGA